jgi:guanylate kinase
MAGKLVILSGPSGAGKSTIVKHLLGIEDYNLVFSISACSRKMRSDEVEGKDYYFLSIDAFKSKIDDNAFLEWEEVYPQHYYGTLHSQVEQLRLSGKNVIFDVDVVGGLNIKRYYKENAISIFINSPSIEELERRLKSRNTDSDENIAKRVRKAKMEISYAKKFDYIIENDQLEKAFKDAEQLVSAFLKSE